MSVNVQWTANQSLSGTIELVQNGTVVAAQGASAAPGAPATLSTTVDFSKSGWLAARRMDGNGHQVHTAAVFVIVNDAPVRASAADAQFFVQWIDNLLSKTDVGGAWSSFLTTSRVPARARYQAARDLFQQIAVEAAGGPDTTPPTLTVATPSNGAAGVLVGANVTATFSEALAPGTVNGTTVQLRDAAAQVVAATVSWNAATSSVVLDPSSPLAYSAAYTATVKGGASGVTDVAGNPLAADVTWTFTTQARLGATHRGPGGPILLVTSTPNPFTRYYAEILRTEGPERVRDARHRLPSTRPSLSGYDVVILGEMSLTSAQVTMLTTWVNGGGKLIAMRPDPQLASLLGLTDAGDARSPTPTSRRHLERARAGHRRADACSSTARPTSTRSPRDAGRGLGGDAVLRTPRPPPRTPP